MTAVGRQVNPSAELLALAKYVRADISEPLPLLKADVCVHSAGLASDTATYEELHSVNVLGTQHVFEAVEVRHFIQISSASVYPILEQIIRESDADLSNDLSDYGRTKLMADVFLQQKKPSIPITILRPRAIYGVRDTVLLPRILKLIRPKGIIGIGNLKVKMSMTHVENLLHAVDCALAFPQQKMVEVFNICDAEPYVLKNVFQTLGYHLYQKQLPTWAIYPVFLSKIVRILERLKINIPLSQQSINYLTKSTILDLEKAKCLLHYQPKINFETTAATLIKK